MIPAQIEDEGVSSSEQKIFRLLDRDPDTQDWIVLHSLGLARRKTGPFGEIDFVAIIPGKGIVCLEVKGGRVACKHGEWQTTNRYGEVARLKKSPFMQSRDSMFALRTAIVRHFGESSPEGRCPIGCGVVFPDVSCPPPSPEFERSDVIDSKDLRDPISRSIARLANHRLREFRNRDGSPALTAAKAKSIANFLRPDFELVVAKGTSVQRSEEKLISLTEEQYEMLDALEENPRCLFEGAAGTGKTLLALEYARRAKNCGSKVLLVCFNRLLGEWLSNETKDSGIRTGTWHRFVKDLIATSSVSEEFAREEHKAHEAGDIQKIFDEIYPFYGEVALEELGAMFDVLVVDEAQDVCRQNMLDVLNLSLVGGLASGRWAMFGDFTRQALYGGIDKPIDVLASYGEHFVRARLTLNCRNTRRIAIETSLLSGFQSPPFRTGEVEGVPVEHRYWKNPRELVEVLKNIVERLVNENVCVEDIVILSARRREHSALAEVQKISHFPIVDVTSTQRNFRAALKFSTIHSFKGLESSVVILLGIEEIDTEEWQSLLYVGMSRARSLLVLMISERSRESIQGLIRRGIAQELEG